MEFDDLAIAALLLAMVITGNQEGAQWIDLRASIPIADRIHWDSSAKGAKPLPISFGN